MVHTSAYPPVYVTVDVVLLTIRHGALQVMLVKRGSAPFRGRWALPGGFVRQREDLPAAARRELAEETGLDVDLVHLEQLATFGRPGRDPRARTVSVAHLAVLPALGPGVGGTDATDAAWRPVVDALALRLPFDHTEILAAGLERARSKLEYTTLAVSFVEAPFTVAELRHVYEVVWGRPLDPGNFHRKVLGSEGFVRRTDASRPGARGRPAALFTPGDAPLLNPPILCSPATTSGGPS